MKPVMQRTYDKIKNMNYKELAKSLIILYIIIYASFEFYAATSLRLAYAEVDSYALPVISIQYRGSLTMNETDLKQAQIDFPELYEGIDSFEDLRSAKLVKATDDPNTWLSHYFPIYSITCLPMKIILQLLGLPQCRAFALTNACLLISALVVVCLFLKVSETKKMFLILCLSLSPVVFYTTYISAEVMIFSSVTIALVMYHEKHYKTAGILITLAGWTNPTVMILGAVMIVNYLVDIFIKDKNSGLKALLKNNIVNVLKLALCYVWCFIPFIFNAYYIKTANSTFGAASTDDWLGRVWAYFFDVNLGFSTFAIAPLFLSIIAFPFLIAKKKYSCIYYYVALIGTVMAYSLMKHINCGMYFCARYVVWSYPMLAFITVIFALDIFKSRIVRGAASLFTCASLILLIMLNLGSSCLEINSLTKLIWNNVPSAYSPLPSTFHSRILHIDGAYYMKDVAEYVDEDNNYVRKILLMGNEESKAEVLSRYTCAEGEESDFIKMVEAVPNDGGYHYIDISPISSFQLTKLETKSSD